jgi:tripartite-type tricarboxylate transporter receptor subunit TctC
MEEEAMFCVSRQMQLRWSSLLIALVVALACSAQLDAASGSSKPIRFIVPWAAGGGTDITARVYAANLSRRLNQTIIVDNRTGASGIVGVDVTAKAPPDGSTICIISASSAVNSATNQNLPYDLVKDLQGVSQLIAAPFVLVVLPSFPAKSVGELIAYAKANPGKLNFGSSGIGGLTHLAGAMLGHMSQTNMVHVAYRGEAAAIIDLLNGSTQFQVASLLNANPHINSGRLRALGITSSKRNSALPDIPTIAEAGVPGYEVSQWYGVVTAAKVPKEIVEKLSADIAVSARDPEVAQRLKTDGVDAVSSKPEEFSAHVKSEVARWGTLVKNAGLKLQ